LVKPSQKQRVHKKPLVISHEFIYLGEAEGILGDQGDLKIQMRNK